VLLLISPVLKYYTGVLEAVSDLTKIAFRNNLTYNKR